MAYMFRKYEIYVYMFAGCSSLKQINFHSFVTNNVKFINPLASPGEGVTVFISPYLSAGAPALGEAKGLMGYFMIVKL